MSPRAAARLEAMGFTRVYDYVGGKKDWLAADLPVVGQRAGQPRSGDLARREPPTCRPGDWTTAVDRARVEAWGLCVVTDEANIVHGLVTPDDLATSRHEKIDEVMQLGPTTIRPSQSLQSALEQIDQLEAAFVLVTTEFGELLGVLYRDDAQAHLGDH